MNATRLGLVAVLLAGCTPDIANDPVISRVIAVYDPAAATPVLPLPNDLALDAATGLLSVPDGDRDSPAQKEFNAYLRGLDGFPTSATPSLTFSGPLDSASITATSVRVLDLTNPNLVSELPGAQLEWNATTLTLTVRGLTFQRARIYGVAVLGSAAQGLKGQSGEEVIGSPTFALLRASRSLVTCTDLGSVDCKSATALIDSTQSALTLERARRRLQPGLAYLDSRGIQRERLAAFWSFSTVAAPLTTFDPANDVVPFPNALAMANGKVSLPAETGDDALTVTLKANLNQLDGFSTSASLVTESGDATGAADARLNASTLSPSQFVLFNLDNPSEEVPLKVSCRSCGGNGLTAGTEPDQVALVPQKPLRSRARYGVLWLDGAKGLDGKPVRAGSVFALARSKNALTNTDGKSNISSLSDVDAALLESLRQTLAPALTAADQKGIARERILLAWDFPTQTTTETLAELRQKPFDWALPSGMVGGPGRTSTLTIPTLVQTLEGFVGQDLTSHLRTMLEGEYLSGNALNPSAVETDLTTMFTTPTDGAFTAAGLAAPRPETIRFFLVLPRVARGPNGKIPVVIFHHGLGQSRKDAFVIANRIAAEGFATLSIDAPFHGLRSYCLADSECLNTTCTNHRCADDLLTAGAGYRVRQLQSPFGGTIDDPTETPVNSGRGYISAADLFATRDHFRQEVIDYAQLLRVLNDTTNGIGAINVDDPATAGVVETLEPANPRYIGQSLGGIAGGLITCANPEIPSAVLNVAGGTQLDIIQYASGFASMKMNVDSYLTGRGWPPGSQRYERFLDIGRWILDPADPQSCGRHFTAEPLKDVVTQQAFGRKRIFLSWTPNDSIVPNYCTEVLERSFERVPDPGFFKNQSYDTGGDHAFLLNVLDTQSAAIAITAQTDAVNWVKQ
jgi:hypothetical protein